MARDPFTAKLAAEAEDILAEEDDRLETKRAQIKMRLVGKKKLHMIHLKGLQKSKTIKKAKPKKPKKPKTSVKIRGKSYKNVVDLRGPDFGRKRRIGVEKKPGWIVKKKRKGGGPGGKWVGPYLHKAPGGGVPMGDDLILDIALSDLGKAEIAFGTFTKGDVVRFLEGQVYFTLYAIMMDLIARKVPRDTGLLRQRMRHSISKAYSIVPSSRTSIDDMRLTVMLMADVGYAGIVNRMPTSMLAHPGSHKGRNLRSRKTGKRLRDPDAATNFYNVIKEIAWRKARDVTSGYITRFPPGTFVVKVGKGQARLQP